LYERLVVPPREEDAGMTALRRLCGKTRKMTGRENLDFAHQTSSGEAHGRATRGKIARAAEPSIKAVYGRAICDRREKSSFSTQSANACRSRTTCRTGDIDRSRYGRMRQERSSGN
jgi:hypothetical protein